MAILIKKLQIDKINIKFKKRKNSKIINEKIDKILYIENKEQYGDKPEIIKIIKIIEQVLNEFIKK